jgi:hypothetical protein
LLLLSCVKDNPVFSIFKNHLKRSCWRVLNVRWLCALQVAHELLSGGGMQAFATALKAMWHPFLLRAACMVVTMTAGHYPPLPFLFLFSLSLPLEFHIDH